jgi:hypothetical protein
MSVVECRVCKQNVPDSTRAAWAIRTGQRICRPCHNACRRALRRRSVAHRIRDRIRNKHPGCRMSLVEIKEVLRLAGSKSVISGATEKVTIIRADPSKPLSVANAVVVTTDEAVAGLRRLPPRLSSEHTLVTPPCEKGPQGDAVEHKQNLQKPVFDFKRERFRARKSSRSTPVDRHG